jgi:RNA polymerase sigma-70 factor (ECF subfamily)
MSEDEALFRRLQMGDEDALRCLLPVVHARVARAARRWKLLPACDVREQILDWEQGAWARLFAGALWRWDRERGLSLRNFVGMVAECFVIDQLRCDTADRIGQVAEHPMQIDGEVSIQRSPDLHVAARQESARVWATLVDRLGSRGREVLYHSFVCELDATEVQCRTGLSVEAIHQWRSRIRRLAHDIRADLGIVAYVLLVTVCRGVS